jgi:hypothetical protein
MSATWGASALRCLCVVFYIYIYIGIETVHLTVRSA